MQHATVRATLRIVAIVVIVIGLILTSQGIATWISLPNVVFGQNLQGVAFTGVVTQALITGWGLILFAFSDSLAARIVRD